MSDFLFARPSFLEGVARIGDFSGSLTDFNRCANGAQTDYVALKMDSLAVAQDMHASIAEADKQVKQKRR